MLQDFTLPLSKACQACCACEESLVTIALAADARLATSPSIAASRYGVLRSFSPRCACRDRFSSAPPQRSTSSSRYTTASANLQVLRSCWSHRQRSKVRGLMLQRRERSIWLRCEWADRYSSEQRFDRMEGEPFYILRVTRALRQD